MNETFGDARLEELLMLSEIDRKSFIDISPIMVERNRSRPGEILWVN